MNHSEDGPGQDEFVPIPGLCEHADDNLVDPRYEGSVRLRNEPSPKTLESETSGERVVPWYKQIPSAKRTIRLSAIAYIMALIVLAAGFFYIQRIPQGDSQGLGILAEALSGVFNSGSGERVFGSRERLNILCLGIDYNRDSQGIGFTKGARSDTMFVVSIDQAGKTLNILSIPRDTQVYISEACGYDKINSAFQQGGVELASKVVSEFLGVPIHHYVIIRVPGAKQMVDALGGLTVDVEKDMDYDDNWGNLHIHLKRGEQVLNGEQAVGYSRFRMDAESDRGRIRRQQQVMMALVKRLKDPTVVLRLQAIVKAVKENVETDLSVLDLLDLTYLYKDFDRRQIKTGAIVGEDADINGVSYIIPFGAENEKTIMELLKKPTDLSRADVRIEVLNGCGKDGAAGAVADLLRREGFKVVSVGEAKTSDHYVTEISDHLGSTAVRSVLESLLLGCTYEVDAEANVGKRVDITIIVGLDRVEGSGHGSGYNSSGQSEVYSGGQYDQGNSEPSAPTSVDAYPQAPSEYGNEQESSQAEPDDYDSGYEGEESSASEEPVKEPEPAAPEYDEPTYAEPESGAEPLPNPVDVESESGAGSGPAGATEGAAGQ